ncbi:ABC transporter ATP-binding protein [Mycolicibacterium sp. P1-18]|uniref:ABC transporter ATP-binding protein n=1 Tax=Mycolicibacterium sp. P1-18 TaxID=2024615 RepID=UPI0011F17F82|nr:ATP-binding cassette domain-containing protein [Mycolicibacterium sp. P1-18]KAA0096772.1 ABC transporter ATP-binding protein [Mycolicibacterium sp. P1-18]
MPETLLAVDGLRKVFGHHVAVDSATFAVAAGGSLAIVGESGSGKTTVARMIAGLERPSAGTITVEGVDRPGGRVSTTLRRRWARQIQIVFQDPYGSLDRRQSARDSLREILDIHDSGLDDRAVTTRIEQLLDQVGLDTRQAGASPRALSGGQRQRIAIARALAADPQLLILDEAVAALDVSIQAQILNLLAKIRRDSGTAYLFITHDLAVARHIADDVIVMHRGSIVERGPIDDVLRTPNDDYTKRLIASVPRPGWKPRRGEAVIG